MKRDLKQEVEDLKKTIMFLVLQRGGEVKIFGETLISHNLENMTVEVLDNAYDYSKTIRVREMTEEEQRNRDAKVNAIWD